MHRIITRTVTTVITTTWTITWADEQTPPVQPAKNNMLADDEQTGNKQPDRLRQTKQDDEA